MYVAAKNEFSVCCEKWTDRVVAIVDRQWVPDVRSRHTERMLSCLSTCHWNKQAQSISGPQRLHRFLALQQFVEVWRDRRWQNPTLDWNIRGQPEYLHIYSFKLKSAFEGCQRFMWSLCRVLTFSVAEFFTYYSKKCSKNWIGSCHPRNMAVEFSTPCTDREHHNTVLQRQTVRQVRWQLSCMHLYDQLPVPVPPTATGVLLLPASSNGD